MIRNQNSPQIVNPPQITHQNRQQRKFTDKICAFIYIGITIFLLIVALYGVISKSYVNVYTPTDPDGKRCGIDYPNYPYIYFAVPFPEAISKTVCVKECPKGKEQVIDCQNNSLVHNCIFNRTDIYNYKNQFLIYETHLLYNACMPTSNEILQILKGILNLNSIFQYFSDLYYGRYVILIATPVASIVLVGIFLLGMIHFTKIAFISAIVIFYISIVGIIAYMFNFEESMIIFEKTIIGSVIVFLLFTVSLIICINRNRFTTTLKIIDGIQQYNKNYLVMFLISIMIILFWLIIIAFELISYLLIYSVVESFDTKEKYVLPYFLSIKHSIFIKFCLYLQLAHGLWTTFIISNCKSFYIATIISQDVYINVQSESIDAEISQIYKNAFKNIFFHFGSICIGGILISCFWWISLIITFIRLFSSNPYLYQIQYMFEISIYTIINLTDLSYFKAAFQDPCKSIKRYELLQHQNGYYGLFASFLISMVKISIATLSIIISFAILKYTHNTQDTLAIYVIIFIFSYIITTFLTSTYEQNFISIIYTFFYYYTEVKKSISDSNSKRLAESRKQKTNNMLTVLEQVFQINVNQD